jgi:hypothetical protein
MKIYDDIPKIRKRANWVRQNFDKISVAWGLNLSDIKIFNVIVTPRPNYYGKQVELNYGDFKYFTLNDIIYQNI